MIHIIFKMFFKKKHFYLQKKENIPFYINQAVFVI